LKEQKATNAMLAAELENHKRQINEQKVKRLAEEEAEQKYDALRKQDEARQEKALAQKDAEAKLPNEKVADCNSRDRQRVERLDNAELDARRRESERQAAAAANKAAQEESEAAYQHKLLTMQHTLSDARRALEIQKLQKELEALENQAQL
jgi:hypothetical protein